MSALEVVLDETQKEAIAKLRRAHAEFSAAQGEEARRVQQVLERMRVHGQTLGDASNYVGLAQAIGDAVHARGQVLEAVARLIWAFPVTKETSK